MSIGKRKENPVNLVLTGERANRLVLPRLNGKPVPLSYRLFELLVELIIARGNSAHGYYTDLEDLPVRICHLRNAISGAVGPGMGHSVVETGAGKEYRLAIPANQIVIEPDCAELTKVGFLTSRQFEELSRYCRWR